MWQSLYCTNATGPFAEEEVEDVKTVLQLLVCINISVTCFWPVMDLDAIDKHYVHINCVLNTGVLYWMVPLLLVPLYQFLLYPLLHKWVPSMLKRIGVGLFLQLYSGLCFLYGLANKGVHSYNELFNMHSIQGFSR